MSKYGNFKDYTKEELKKKQAGLDNSLKRRKHPVLFSSLVNSDEKVKETYWDPFTFKVKERMIPLKVNKALELTKVKDLGEILYRMFQTKDATVANKRLQCDSGRLRSIQDAYIVAKSYLPDLTYEQLYKAVTSLYGKLIKPSYCTTVNKRVHSPYNAGSTKQNYSKALGKLNIKNPSYGKSEKALEQNS